jgi:hypothetical protein
MRHRTAMMLIAAVVLGAGTLTPVLAARLPPALAPLEFLTGDWEGSGSGTPGQGQGGTTFAPGLQDRVLIRTNVAITAASGTTPASRHDDLMIVYVDERGAVRADYYDNEGHVIRYAVTSPRPGQAVFTSDATAAGPQYRLTYDARPSGVVSGTFAIAPPGKPGAFSPYLTWEMKRKAPAHVKRP